ncbi:hypothetical protein ACIBBB_19465 [Streptomyces sp. NPDC051217]|uniref:hypothetical protein n=1 Tax=Streptomyces sp. NPDC051217 TaxID=3365644 RepID=UPI0037A0C6C0
MFRRAPLPPPPPPAHLRDWPDREALLAERAAAMTELQRRGLSVVRMLRLWSLGLGAGMGWVLFSLGLGHFEDRTADYITGLVELVLGVIVMVPAVIGAGFGVARDRTARERLDAWAGLAPDPRNDHRLRAGARSGVWLGMSVALCVVGLGLALTGGGRPDSAGLGEVAYLVGIGVIALVIGVLGAIRALLHQRWAGHVLSPAPERGRGGAHR